MNSVDKIRSAEDNVADLQVALEKVQLGLQRAESVAVAANAAKESGERTLRVAIGLVAVSVLLIVFSLRRSGN